MIHPTLALMGHYMTAHQLSLLEYAYRTGSPIRINGALCTVPELTKGISIFGAGFVSIEITFRELPPLGVPYPLPK